MVQLATLVMALHYNAIAIGCCKSEKRLYTGAAAMQDLDFLLLAYFLSKKNAFSSDKVVLCM